MDGDRATVLERAPWVRRHKLNVDGYYRMAEFGLLAPDERVELIEGEIIDLAPIGSGYSGTTIGLNETLAAGLQGRALVAVQTPLRLSRDSEPQPDLMVLTARRDRYRDSHPTPTDVLLLIEVADSSLRFDRAVRLPLYARHNIPEVWIVNLVEQVVELHRNPEGESWRLTHIASRGEALEPAALPGLRVTVDEILG